MKHQFQLSKIAASLAVIGGVAFVSSNAMAATPLAGTNISNIATASYVDNTNTTRTVTSNEVTTSVAQVGSFTLVADRQAETTPNGKVEMHHVLTNTGNGTDTFTLDLTNTKGDGTFEFETGKFAVYLDRNLDGVPDNSTDLAKIDTTTKKKPSIELASGESVGLIVVATTPNSATAGQIDKLELVATAGQQTIYTTGKATNIDTVKIVEGAVVSITKAASVNSAKVGDIIEYTLTFKNTGNATATNVAIFDVLPNNVKYVTDSARYSGSTADLQDKDNPEDNYRFFDVETTTGADGKTTITTAARLLLNIPTLGANTTGTLKFKVQVLSSSLNTVDNTAYVDPDGDNNTPYDENDLPELPEPPTTTPTGSTPSNESKVPVVGSYSGAINDTAKDSGKDGATLKDGDDKIILSGQKDGVPVVFGGKTQSEGNKVVVHNSGNTVDTYNLTIDRTALADFIGTKQLPAGTIIDILKSDGATPVTDTNGDGIVDTGPIQPGLENAQEFVIRVTLPNGSTDDKGYSFLVNSTSITNKVVDTLKLATGPITANKVDLVNKPNGTTENGTGSPTDDGYTTKHPNEVVEEKTTPPGSSTTFDMTIKNDGNVPDNYVITVPNVPTDWKVEIFEKDENGNCTNTKVTNSGNIKQQEAKSFCVTVTPPPGTPAGTEEKIKVEIKSPSTGTSDNITYLVEVEEQRGLSFNPDRQGQVAPGGTVEYVHTLTNTGNVVEGGEATKPNSTTPYNYELEIDWSSTLADTTTSIYVDLNGNGLADTNELVKGSTAAELNTSFNKLLENTNGKDGLSPEESIQIIVKVQTPATATAGEKDTTILTITPTDKDDQAIDTSSVAVTDLTTINLGQVRLSKTQAKATTCGNVPNADDFGTATITAKPGECVYYRVTAVNDGNEDAKDVKISDMVPSYTTYFAGSIQPKKNTTEPTSSSNEVRYDVGTLTPAAKATLEFAVKVDQ